MTKGDESFPFFIIFGIRFDKKNVNVIHKF